MKLFLIILICVLITGCFPDRHPYSPEELQTRRPKVAFIYPNEESDHAGRETGVTVWFDDLMQEQSAQNAFSLQFQLTEPGMALDMTIGAAHPHYQVLLTKETGGFTNFNLNSRALLESQAWYFARPLAPFQAKFVEFHPLDQNTLYICTDNRVYQSSDLGLTWTDISDGLPSSVVITSLDFGNMGRPFLGTTAGVFYRIGQGAWSQASELPQWNSTRYIQHVLNPVSNTIFVSTEGRFVYKSTDSGNSWTMLRQGLQSTKVYKVLVAPDKENTYYAATEAGFAVSRDNGETWQTYTQGLDDPRIRDLAISEQEPYHIWALTVSGVFSSLFHGESWEKLFWNPDLLYYRLINKPGTDELYLLTGEGVYFSADAGATWDLYNSVAASSLQIKGSFQFETWRGEIAVGEDSTLISPYIYEQALKGWDGSTTPPVDPDPQATKMIFTPEQPLAGGWTYAGVIRGTFENDRETLKQETGAKNIYDMSLEIDEPFMFTVAADQEE